MRTGCGLAAEQPGSQGFSRERSVDWWQPGGIRSAAMLGLGVQGPVFVATATAIGIAVDAVRMPVYFATESARIFSAWPAILAGVIGVVFGTVAGVRVLRRIPEQLFRRVVS